MYKVIFEYTDGRRGTCRENGEPVLFEDEHDAAKQAAELNALINEDMKPFFPVYKVKKT